MRLLKTNKLAFFVAILVGLLYVGPHLFFIFALGSDYKGIPMMPSANESDYMYRIRNILDGDYLLGSPLYYEYRNQMPMMPPVGEYFYALPALLFKISPANVLIASKFVLPAILFLLIYFLVQKLIYNPISLSSQISSVAAGLLITLGYDLIDYRSIINWLMTGDDSFLHNFSFLWARPVNPIIGAIFLFSFLLAVCSIWQDNIRKKRPIVLAAIFLTIMFGNYFFSWGMAMSILGVLATFSLFKKSYAKVQDFVSVAALWFIFSAPYWLIIWRAKQSPWYQESVLRNGLFLTHYPLINKFLVFVIIIYAIIVFVLRVWWSGRKLELQSWHWFSLVMILGSFLAYNQQIFTGRTIWPFHFVQYSIPLGLIVLILLLHNYIKPKLNLVWQAAISLIILVTLTYGIYAQSIAYPRHFNYFAKLQPYSIVFNWLDQKKGDCVVLVDFNSPMWSELAAWVADFSHCDIYAKNWYFSMLPFERSLDNYMTILRWRGVRSEDIDNYMKQNEDEAAEYLFSNWQGLFNAQQFPDFQDFELMKRLKEFSTEYKEFMKLDLKTVLKKYRLDYILSVGSLKSDILNQLSYIKPVFESSGLFIYSFQ